MLRMLEPVQKRLLSTLVVASRALPETERTPFQVVPSIDEMVEILHPALPRQALSAYPGDLRVLEVAKLILVGDRSPVTGSFHFDITPAGFQEIEGPSAASHPLRWGRWESVASKPLFTSRMSVVWRVRDTEHLGAPSRALKELRYEKGRGSAGYRRFVREIETLAERLKGKHPGIISVLDYTVPADGDDSRPYYVMPCAELSLAKARWLKGYLEPSLTFAVHIAEALSAAHQAGIIHRDVKPANVLLFGEDQVPVLCDFGICFLEAEDRLTRSEADTIGTDDFVAPELLGGGQSDKVSCSADVYSLGKTLYALVEGGSTFPRERFDDPRFDLADRFKDTRLEHLRGLMEVMVTEDPARRLQTMDQVRDTLTRALQILRAGLPYKTGMYRQAGIPTERLVSLGRLLELQPSVKRSDHIREAVEQSIEAAQATAKGYSDQLGGTLRFSYGKAHEEAASIAASCAEELMSAGIALVASDMRDEFEEWLMSAVFPIRQTDGNQHLVTRIVLEPAGVLAAHGAGVFAWKHRRLALLRRIVDEYVKADRGWIHHEVLANNAVALQPWMAASLTASVVLQRADRTLAAAPSPALSFVSGLAVLKFLAGADRAELDLFMAAPDQQRWPIPFAPGLVEIGWAAELVDVGTLRPALERDLAKVIFDMNVTEFRQFCNEQTKALATCIHVASRRISRRQDLSDGVDLRRWKEWCGGSP